MYTRHPNILFSSKELWTMAICTPSTPLHGTFAMDILQEKRHPPNLIELYELAKHERLAPLFAWRLERNQTWPLPLQHQAQQLPPEILSDARLALRNQRKHALLQEHLLMLLSKHLQELQTTAILYKGAAYERGIYPQCGLRPMADLDIILPSTTYSRFCQQLLARGFQTLLQHPHEHSFRHQQTNLVLDVHVDLSPQQEGRFDPKELFDLAMPIAPQSPILLLPTSILLLLHLFHMRGNGMNPSESTLLSIVDLLLLAQQSHDQRSFLLQQARRWHAMGLLRFAEALLSQLPLVQPITFFEGSTSPREKAQRALLLRILRRIRHAKHTNQDPQEHFQTQQDKILRLFLRALCYDNLHDLARSQGKQLANLVKKKLFTRVSPSQKTSTTP